MILVIGYGNSLCGDDGVGPYIVERLALADAASLSDVEYLAFRQLTPELAEPISRAETAIFVDASDGPKPGLISCVELTPLAEPSQAGPGAFTHHVKAAILLESARFLYGKHPTAYLYTVAGENFNLGNSFSPAVALALPSLFDQLKARIANA
jgi:hydrogenase maturation protease